jgi:hypothetical protein
MDMGIDLGMGILLSILFIPSLAPSEFILLSTPKERDD